MVRKKILVANWKMNKTVSETVLFFDELKKRNIEKISNVEVIIAPPFTSLETAARCIQGTRIGLAAQNMYWETKGAFTGEISVKMLQELHCQHVILGHSERRSLFFETDDEVNKKIDTALKNQLKVILCVGETLKEREQNQTFLVLERQLLKTLSGISKEALKNVVVAYEPIWAIGTGKVATAEQAEEAHRTIRKTIWDQYDMDVASQVSILYGGSVKPQNFFEISRQPNVDGGLVGGGSLEVDSFIEILGQMK